MGYIMSNAEQSIKVKAANYENAEVVYDKLMRNLANLINQCDESDEQVDKITKDVLTDVVIPGIKDTYQRAVEYVLWGNCPRTRVNRYQSIYRGIKIDRDYTDEEEDSEDE